MTDRKTLLLSALESIPADDYETFIKVGMAMKLEGLTIDQYDQWARKSSKYTSRKEIENKWFSFRREQKDIERLGGITGLNIFLLAKGFGWKAPIGTFLPEMRQMRAEIDAALPPLKKVIKPAPAVEELPETELSPTEQLREYLTTLFNDSDWVRIAPKSKDGHPAGNGEKRICADLLYGLENQPEDITLTIGEYYRAAGGWISFNPFEAPKYDYDEKGGVNVINGFDAANITRFDYVLIECDEIPIIEQWLSYQQLNLPIACLVSSGHKSLHAIVRVNAKNKAQYDNRVAKLFEFLEYNGLALDKQTKNANRLSRMPGLERGENFQELLAVNIGASDWNEWCSWLIHATDDFPDIDESNPFTKEKPLKPAIIDGILRSTHKLLITAASKAGKTYSGIELCIDLCEGLEWLGHKCQESTVLYVNMEIDPASFDERIRTIYKSLNITANHAERFKRWHLRGHGQPLANLIDRLIDGAKRSGADVVFIDPCYKLMEGNENDAETLVKFTNLLDRICAAGFTVVYVHHHPKGNMAGRRAIDRGSGSGVAGRDADAIIDFIELEPKTDSTITEWNEEENGIPLRMSYTLREFRSPPPVDVLYKFPLHVLDTDGLCVNMDAELSPASNGGKASAKKMKEAAENRKTELSRWFYQTHNGKPAPLAEAVKRFELTPETIKDKAKELGLCIDGADLICRPEDYKTKEQHLQAAIDAAFDAVEIAGAADRKYFIDALNKGREKPLQYETIRKYFRDGKVNGYIAESGQLKRIGQQLSIPE